MLEYKTRVFLITFLAFVGVHSLRTSYSFSKSMIANTVQVDDTSLGLTDSVLLYGLAIGYLQLALLPLPSPVRGLFIGMLLVSLFYILVPIMVTFIPSEAFAILCVLMAIDGYFQSWTWPHLLMLVNSYYDNKKESLKLGFWMTSSNFGNILGFVVCQFLVLNNSLPWQVSMFAISGYLIVIALLVFFFIQELPKVHEQRQQSAEQSLLTESKSESEAISVQQRDNNMSQSHLQGKIQHKQNILKILKSPVVILVTISYSLIKSISYGILFWLPLYFDLIGLQQYSAYIPITYDTASIFSSLAVGFAFKRINNKGILLAPLTLLLVICFALLHYLKASVAVNFVLIACAGLFLGGTYNAMGSLIAMELVKVVPPRYRAKELGFYTAVLMGVANVITASLQIVIGFGMSNDQSLIFVIFFWLAVIILILLIAVGIIQYNQQENKGQQMVTEREIQIVETH